MWMRNGQLVNLRQPSNKARMWKSPMNTTEHVKGRAGRLFMPKGSFLGKCPSKTPRGQGGALTASNACMLSPVQHCDPMDCSPPDSSVHGVLQARTLEWVVIPFSGGSSQPGIRPNLGLLPLLLCRQILCPLSRLAQPCLRNFRDCSETARWVGLPRRGLQSEMKAGQISGRRLQRADPHLLLCVKCCVCLP